MERQPLVNTRTVFIVVSILTILLLVGSAILQRVVFHAAEINSSVFLDGVATNVVPRSDVTYNLKANLAGNAVVAGSQFVIRYDPTLISFSAANSTAPWQSQKIMTKANGTKEELWWALSPSPDQGKAVNLNGTVSFGSLTFHALKNGLATISLDQTQTMIIGVDSENQGNIYNGVSSVQDAQLLISDKAVASTSTTPIALNSNSAVVPVGTTQRILSDDAFTTNDQALVLVGLKYKGQVTVRFGTNEQITTKVQTSGTSDNQPVRLLNLQPNTQYFYQVSVLDADGHSTITGQVKSFHTVISSNEAVDADSTILQIFPVTTADTTQLYILPRDKDGNSIDIQPALSLENGSANIAQTNLGKGLYLAVIKNILPTKQKVSVAVTINNTKLGSQSVLFDPEVKSLDQPKFDATNKTSLSTSGLTTIGVLAVVFVVTLIGLAWRSRVK